MTQSSSIVDAISGKAKALLSHLRPALASAGRKIRRLPMSKQESRRQVFRDIYKHNLWGTDGNSRFFSGVGSRGEALDVYVERMAELLEDHTAELGRPLTLIDLGCGDFQVGSALLRRLPGLRYVGCDIVPELIQHNEATYADAHVSFRQLDIVADALPAGDVCLVRQVLQHLSNAEIQVVLGKLAYRHVYVTEGRPRQSSGPVNPDKVTGASVRFNWRTGLGRGVELGLPPYGLTTREVFQAFTPPHEMIVTEHVSGFALVNAAPAPRAADAPAPPQSQRAFG